jgi:hypothetical protein
MRRHPGDVGVEQRDAQSSVEAAVQAGADARSEAVTVGEEVLYYS